MRAIVAAIICAVATGAHGAQCQGQDGNWHDYNSPACQPAQSRESDTARWFDGGTLHDATAGQWREATYQNKLATAADWLAATKWKGHVNTPRDIARVKIAADKVVRGLDLIVRETRDQNEKVSVIAVAIIQMANDVGP